MNEEQNTRELSDEALDTVSGGYMDHTAAYKNYVKKRLSHLSALRCRLHVPPAAADDVRRL